MPRSPWHWREVHFDRNRWPTSRAAQHEGAPLHHSQYRADPNAVDDSGYSALHYAAERNESTTVQVLLTAGAIQDRAIAPPLQLIWPEAFHPIRCRRRGGAIFLSLLSLSLCVISLVSNRPTESNDISPNGPLLRPLLTFATRRRRQVQFLLVNPPISVSSPFSHNKYCFLL